MPSTPSPMRRDAARAFDAERHRPIRQARVETQRLHDVAEVEGGGQHLDLHLVRPGRAAVDLAERQAVEDSQTWAFEPVGAIGLPIGTGVEICHCWPGL